MRDACRGKRPGVYRTSRKFDSDSRQVLFIAEEILPTEIPDHWGLVIGEIIHNLRCALDHLWWQLAIDHLGHEPIDDEAPNIQFPILTRTSPDAYFTHRFFKHVDGKAAEKAKPLQGYDGGEDDEPWIQVLADLSNHDKHREIKPSFYASSSWSLDQGKCIDCHLPRAEEPGVKIFSVEYSPSEVAVGDVVLGIEVVPTGPNPDIELEPQITGNIGFGRERDIPTTLKELGALVHAILIEFAPLLGRPTGPYPVSRGHA